MTEIQLSAPFNQRRLTDELVAAGRDARGCGASVLAFGVDESGRATSGIVRFGEPIPRASVEAIIAAHDGSTQVEDQIDVRLAVLIRTSSHWAGLSANRKAKIMAIIDNEAARIIAGLS